MHITASVYINDDEQGLLHDYDRFLERIAPHDPVPDQVHAAVSDVSNRQCASR